jgi:hypothetical protein
LIWRPKLKFAMTVPVRKAGPKAGPPFSLEQNNRSAADPGVLRPKIEFTGLGCVPTLRQRPRVGAKALT